MLVFVLINPTHFDDLRQEVVPLAFQEVHNRDLSVLRAEHTTPGDLRATVEELVERGMDRVPPQLRFVEFGCQAAAAEVRQVSDDRGRLFAVYDTALHAKPGHASIFTRDDVLLERRRKAKARNALHRVFTASAVPIEDVIRGLA